MGAAALPLLIDQRESLRGSLVVSLGLHGLLFVFAIGYAALGLHQGAGWGNPWGKGSSARVNVVTSLPGMPLPAPMLATQSTLATENPGLYQKQPTPKPEPTEEAQEIPKFKEAVKPPTASRINKRIQKEALLTPPNAIPFGEGGRPSITYGQFVNSEGGGGLSFGEGGFGDRYGWYVQAVRNRISSNWLMSTISPNIVTARRIYVHFDILGDGTLANIQLSQSSGIPEIDRSALRAVYASNPVGPLPQDYSGNKVSVEFYFDFHRQ